MNKDELNMSDRLSRRDFLKVAGAATVSTFLAACGFDPNSTEIDPRNTPLPIPISTKEIHSAGQYEFIEESEIISKLPGPFKAFTNDQKIKDLFTDPISIEYSASGIKVYDLNDNPTAYTFFNATSTKEEKGRTAMIFGGDQGEVVYIVLNRIIDSDGSVGLGITQDPATGNDLEKSLMIFDTGLSETQIEKMTIKELSSINVNFIPGGILVPSEKLLGSKVQAMLLKPEVLAPKTVEQLNISNPETFKFRSWEELTSPAYLAELEQKEKEGLLPKIPDNPSYIKPGFVILNDESTNSEIMKHYAYETIFSLSNEIAYSDQDKRPYTLVDICKTNFMGLDMIFFVNKWENSDGSSGFLAHFVPDYSLTREVGLNIIVGRDENQYPTGGFFVKKSGLDGLKLYLDQWGISGNDYSKFIKYYYSNPEIFLPTKVYQDWQSSGNLVTSVKLPISPAGSNRITK